MIGGDSRVEIMRREGKYWARIYIDLVVDDVCGCMTLRRRMKLWGFVLKITGIRSESREGLEFRQMQEGDLPNLNTLKT